ncbi:alpha/beta hydrolase [Paenibacillus sp. LHD-38]|uniref:alpha/beta fold hydrolase n=1 Tax=Paenibacillus sp. LHD-38 TaxID=3072143 RepID=UPI00280DBE07|nr:alpha/beta hydrolase [Paenibacillus sp. LHD-38]MDQ8734264.1 alpha/beta hydrolase [Paenibacillus sp. LHD-38]
MEGVLIEVRGKRLYVEIHGNENAPSLLYLHGGPGESCYEFMLHQTQRLSDKLRLISIDQRGVWRSDIIEEDEPLNLQDLVEDCEQLRKNLGIQRWSVLGHSFGGFLGVLYASYYPNSIECLILEGPSFDFIKSFRNWLRKAASLYESIGKVEKARECLAVANGNQPPHETLNAFIELGQGLGELRMKVYTPNDGNNYTKMLYSDSQMEEFGRRSNIHFSKLIAEGRIFDSLLPKLKDLSVPALLIKGRHDPVICEEQTQTFVRDVRNGFMKIYDESGHLPHFEEPDRFAMDVIQFVLEQNDSSI